MQYLCDASDDGYSKHGSVYDQNFVHTNMRFLMEK